MRPAALYHYNARAAELAWSIAEGQEFTEIFRGIRGDDSVIVKKLLRRALKGPIHPVRETRKSNFARNTIFELVLGSRFRIAGAEVTMGDEADLMINHVGSRLYVECKRQLFEQNIPEAVEKARKQLRRQLDADQSHRSKGGLVAISISKALNSGENWFEVDREESLGAGLASEVRRVHETYCSDYNQQIDTRLVGILYHIFTPAFVRGSRFIVTANEIETFTVKRSFRTTFPVSGDAPTDLLKGLRAE